MELVCLDELGITSFNYYWKVGVERGIVSKEELHQIGIEDGKSYVDIIIVPDLLAANNKFAEMGFEMVVSDAYRSKELYELIYRKRVEKQGKEITDRLLNMQDMPHASGRSVDIMLRQNGQEVKLKDKKDEPGAYFRGFYKNSETEEGKQLHQRQEMIIEIMLQNGFTLGTKNEYFHFNWVGK